MTVFGDGFEGIDPDVLLLVTSREYPAWRRRVEAIRACERPIRLTGRTVVSDMVTAEVVDVFDSADQPRGTLLIPCGNRRASVCAPCARLYQADVFHLIRAGMVGGKGVAEGVVTHPMAFVTLTAPSFGRVHTRADRFGQVELCHGKPGVRTCAHGVDRSCGQVHDADDPLLGTPLCAECYRYRDAVVWNALAPGLWRSFTRRMRRVTLPYVLDVRTRKRADVVRVSFAKVAEFQRRGAVHFHAVIRLDGPCGPDDAPPASATVEALAEAVALAVPLAWAQAPGPGGGHYDARFGGQFDIKPLAPFDDQEAANLEAVASYIAKYATKGAECAGLVDHRLGCRFCKASGLFGACPSCGGTGLANPLESLGLGDHARRLIEAAWEAGGTREGDALGLRRWAHQGGFGGHFSTRSRLYSTTLGALREARRLFRAEHTNKGAAIPGGLLRVQREWRLAGLGFSPAEAEAASWVRHWIEHNDTVGRWELADLRAEEEEMRHLARGDPEDWEDTGEFPRAGDAR
jgi:replication initiator protein RepSA